MEKPEIRPIATSKPLNRSSPNVPHMTRSWISIHMQNLVTIHHWFLLPICVNLHIKSVYSASFWGSSNAHNRGPEPIFTQNTSTNNIFCYTWRVISFYIVLYNCIVLYCIVLYCIVLYCIVLYCIVLYCIVPRKDMRLFAVRKEIFNILNPLILETLLFFGPVLTGLGQFSAENRPIYNAGCSM